jgi:hypothetical protein
MIGKTIWFDLNGIIVKGVVLDKILVACIVDANENHHIKGNELYQVVSVHKYLIKMEVNDEESTPVIIDPECITVVN